MNSLIILGRQPAIGIAELASLYGDDKVTPAGDQAALLNLESDLINFDRLGGAVKLCRVIKVIDSVNWPDIERALLDYAPTLDQITPSGKLLIGLSSYGLTNQTSLVQKTGYKIKKSLISIGRNVRIAANKQPSLSSAQVFHNRLTGNKAFELVVVRDRNQTIIGQTVRVQNIQAYASRDRNRPARDPKVGMLPPKLAQTIINLAVGKLPNKQLGDASSDTNTTVTLLDPFCGTGVILQEALLMGYSCFGSDLNPRMINYTQTNLNWLYDKFKLSHDAVDYRLATADATTHQWPVKPNMVASEIYLGQPLGPNTKLTDLQPVIENVNQILAASLRNLADQIAPNTRLCLAIPAWPLNQQQWQHLPILDSLETIGYNRLSFQHVSNDQLIYYRPGQSVARELLVITKL